MSDWLKNPYGTPGGDEKTYSSEELAQMGVNIGELITNEKFNYLSGKVKNESARRGVGVPDYERNDGELITAVDYNVIIDRINNVLDIPRNPDGADLPHLSNVAIGDLITALIHNNIKNKLVDAGNQCMCNCNYCACNCNQCICNCNHACVCNCNYSDERLKTNIVYIGVF